MSPGRFVLRQSVGSFGSIAIVATGNYTVGTHAFWRTFDDSAENANASVRHACFRPRRTTLARPKRQACENRIFRGGNERGTLANRPEFLPGASQGVRRGGNFQ